MVRLPMMEGQEQGANLEEGAKRVETALRAANMNPTIISKDIVGPQVGKDLQFIRINGTVVGGLVGLVIHALTQLA